MWRRTRALQQLDADIRDHLDRQIDENLARGLPPLEARRQALLAFGNPALVREDDWIFRGYEMQDALAAANGALSADLDVCREIDARHDAAPFSETELRPPLERWFLSH